MQFNGFSLIEWMIVGFCIGQIYGFDYLAAATFFIG